MQNFVVAVGRRLKNRTTKWDLFHIAFAAILFYTSYTNLFWGCSLYPSPSTTIRFD
jgi:hypothetical protein